MSHIIKVTMEVDVSATVTDKSVSDKDYAIMQVHRFLQDAQTNKQLNHMDTIAEFGRKEITKAMYEACIRVYKEDSKMLEHMMKTLKVAE